MPTLLWVPTLDAVGSILRARTRDTQGNEVGTFNAFTRPNDDQVDGLIITAARDVSAAVGIDLPEVLWEAGGIVASYRAAMLVELSYFPEQVATGRSPYEQLRALYEESLLSLLARVKGDPPGVTPAPGNPSAPPSPPSYDFPLVSTLDYILGPVPGGYVIPWSGGLFQ